MTCDIEVVENRLLALVKAKLPAKLAEIDAEKADGITLEVPTDDQYFNTTDIDEVVINEVLIVKYGLIETTSVSISAATAQENIYIFLIYLNDMNETKGVLRKKLFRYSRAFKEIFEENFDDLRFVSNIEIQIMAPALWSENENSPAYKVAGVYIQTTLV